MSIFSPYKTDENRVTGAFLSVLEHLNTKTLLNFLELLLDDSSITLIEFKNQYKIGDSVPDGRIAANFEYLIETKITTNKVNENQIERHCQGEWPDHKRLILLTPHLDDPTKTFEKEELKSKVTWANFDKVVETIDEILKDPLLLQDREVFLMDQLKDFITKMGLLKEDNTDQVLIIPAKRAWPNYEKFGIYRCQVGRYFKPSGYLGFYYDKAIQTTLPRILAYVDDFNMVTDDIENAHILPLNDATKEEVKKRLAEVRARLNGAWKDNQKFIVLADKGDSRNRELPKEIENKKLSKAGKPTAFVQKQTYVSINTLRKAKDTSDLSMEE